MVGFELSGTMYLTIDALAKLSSALGCYGFQKAGVII